MDEDKPTDSTAGTLPSGAPAPSPNNGLKVIKEAMKHHGVRGNPKDHVLLMRGNTIVDGFRSFTVDAQLPPVLKAGMVVYQTNRDGHVRPVVIQKVERVPEGGMLNPNPDPPMVERLTLTNGSSEWFARREEVSPVGIPLQPTLVHKRDLARFLGTKLGDMFWNKAAGMRRVTVPQR